MNPTTTLPCFLCRGLCILHRPGVEPRAPITIDCYACGGVGTIAPEELTEEERRLTRLVALVVPRKAA